MQAAARTPNSILRKRANKENDDAAAKAAKRANRLANRRVSFAPDDELETKHIFKEKEDSRDGPQHTPSERLGFEAVDSSHQPLQLQQLPPPLCLGPSSMPSPGNLSPLSMDLTNNSYDQQGGDTQPLSDVAVGYMGMGAQVPLQHQHMRHGDYTSNITINVPGLSTLVEEDEEAAMGDTAGIAPGLPAAGTAAAVMPMASPEPGPSRGPGAGAGHVAASPVSPFVLREMQVSGAGGDDEVRNRWGFTPGADDTLDVSFGRAVMGEATYNHVYGAGTTGDLTRAIKDGHTGGPHVGHQGAVTRALASIAASRAAPAALGAAGQPPAAAAGHATAGQGIGAVHYDADDSMPMSLSPGTGLGLAENLRAQQEAQQPVPHGNYVDAAVRDPQLLRAAGTALPASPKADAQQPRARQPLASAAAPFGMPPAPVTAALPAAHAPAAGHLPHSTPFMENTIKLLEDDHTDAWRLGGAAYDRGRLSVASNKVLPPNYRRGGAGGGGGAETTNLLGPTTQLLATGNNTQALLADTTTNHKAAYERFMRNMPGGQHSAGAGLQPIPPRAGGLQGSLQDATAVSCSNADLRLMAGHDNTNMSLELQTRANMLAMQQQGLGSGGLSGDLAVDAQHMSMDLLREGGLSLDAFALPPEPSANLSQQMARSQQQQQQQANDGRVERAGSSSLAPAPQLALAPRRANVPRITCQEFLCLIDVSFNDRVCRTSFLPQSDPPPKTVVEVYEAAHVTAPYVEAYNRMMVEVSGRLANMQARVGQLEADLSSNNPEIFAAVQMAPSASLETIKEQIIGLKKLCRIRTVRAIKQLQLNSYGDLLEQLDGSRAALQGELAAMTADSERFKQLMEAKVELSAAIERRCQEDDAQLQEGIQGKKRAEGLLLRLEALKLQNSQREKRMHEARTERQRALQERVPKEQLSQELSVLEARASALASRATSTSALTPGREGQMMQQVAQKREEVEALLGLHALRIDLSCMGSTGSFSMVYSGAYDVKCSSLPAGGWDVRVARMAEAAGAPRCPSTSVDVAIAAFAAELSAHVPCAQLPTYLESAMLQLRRLSRAARQLDACWLSINCLQKPEVEQGGWDGQPALALRFLNADTVTQVSITLPWRAVLHADAAAPPYRVEVRNPGTAEEQQAMCEALDKVVLSQLQPSSKYLHGLCHAISAVLNVQAGQQPAAGGEEQEPSASEEGGAVAGPGAATPEQGRTGGAGWEAKFDNPLFTSGMG